MKEPRTPPNRVEPHERANELVDPLERPQRFRTSEELPIRRQGARARRAVVLTLALLVILAWIFLPGDLAFSFTLIVPTVLILFALPVWLGYWTKRDQDEREWESNQDSASRQDPGLASQRREGVRSSEAG